MRESTQLRYASALNCYYPLNAEINLYHYKNETYRITIKFINAELDKEIMRQASSIVSWLDGEAPKETTPRIEQIYLDAYGHANDKEDTPIWWVYDNEPTNILKNIGGLEMYCEILEANKIKYKTFYASEYLGDGRQGQWKLTHILEEMLNAIETRKPEEAERKKRELHSQIYNFNSTIDKLERLIQQIERVDFAKLTSMCKGTLRQADYNEEMAKTKQTMQKILRYVPELAEFADKYDEAKKEIDRIYRLTDNASKFIYGFTADWLAYEYKQLN